MPDEPSETRMALGDHLEELRARLIVALLSMAAAFALCWAFRNPLMAVVAYPHVAAMRDLGLPEALRLLRYQEGFYTYMKVAFVAALLLSSPVVAYQIWAFVRSALKPSEKRLATRYGVVSLALFVAGVVFGFLMLIPLGLRFLILVGAEVAQPTIGVSHYVTLVTTLALVTGLIFELPLVIRFLVRLGIVDVATLTRHRRGAILGAFLVGAVLTPPDPATQILVACPTVVLYEIGIVAAEPNRRNGLRVGAFVLIALLALAGFYARQTHTRRNAVRLVDGGWTLPVGSRLTAADDHIVAEFRNGAQLVLRSRSGLILTGLSKARLNGGEVFVDAVGKGQSVTVVTEAVTAVAENAKVSIRVDDMGSTVTAVKGSVRVVGEGLEAAIPEGHQRRFGRANEPVDSEEVISWTEGFTR